MREKMTKAIYISVNNNDKLYDMCVRENTFVKGNPNIETAALDNTKENQFISKRYNQFLDSWDYGKDAWFILCHNDWEICENILPKLEMLDKGNIYGPIGAKIVSNAKLILCGTIREMSRDGLWTRTLWNRHSMTGTPVDTLDAQCMIVHSSLVKRHHLRFDEKFDFHLYVEDFSINALEKHGIQTEIVKLDCIHHSIMTGFSSDLEKCFNINKDIFDEKYAKTGRRYGGTVCILGKSGADIKICPVPATIKDSRKRLYKQTDVEKIIGQANNAMAIEYDFVKENSRVLDAGCACGDLGLLLQKHKNCRVFGLEYNQESISAAKETGAFEDVRRADLDNFTRADFKDIGKFDFIVLGDVLEHLRDPLETLRKLSDFLSDGGAFVLSIPNIAHASVKAALLCDRWDYTDEGLMDRTHIHFFTWKGIAKELADADLKIVEVRRTLGSLLYLLDFNPFKIIPWRTRRAILHDPHSHVIQYIVLCGKSAKLDFSIEDENLAKLAFNYMPPYLYRAICNFALRLLVCCVPSRKVRHRIREQWHLNDYRFGYRIR
jgi:2-polyprenyl-3-methyl-5-hydroxy-6-metoxy-1,4-benzoquinol methylase